MKNLTLPFLFLFFFNTSFSQVQYEPGYFINNSGIKTECLIKNIDWANNPEGFEYKFSTSSEVKNATLSTIQEFGVYQISKYVKRTVLIDISKNNLEEMSSKKEPKFSEVQIFLKLILEGKANLYSYVSNTSRKYFYSTADKPVEQLVYKKYRITEYNNYKFLENNNFRQQLWENLNCPNFKLNRLKNISYNKSELTKYFKDYNNCFNVESVEYKSTRTKNLFNLSIRPGIINSELAIENTVLERFQSNFGSKKSIRIGLEAEFFLPYNKNKWSFFLEPTFRSFSAMASAENDYFPGNVLNAEIEYNSIDLPLGIRHHMFLDNNSAIFLNGSYVLNFGDKKSIIVFTRADGANLFEGLNINARNNFAFGFGYKFKDKVSLELRYHTGRKLLGDHLNWKSGLKSYSMIFGYSFL